MRFLFAVSLTCALGLSAAGQEPAASTTPSAAELADIMRGLLKTVMPNPLFKQDYNWGSTRKVANGITWEKDGLLRKPKVQEKLKNDGTWRRLRIEAVDPDKTLILHVLNVQKPAKGKLTFLVHVSMQTRITFEQQVWLRGNRLYAGETRAKCRPVLVLACESTTRTQKSNSFLPDVVFRMRVTQARLTYEDLKVEHTAGLGGDAARLLGETMIEFVRDVRPSLEKDMLEKANKAIVKAADTKEIKLGLGKMFDGK